MKNKIALIDLGSQTFRLAIVNFDKNSFNIEVSLLKDIKLAEGLQKTGLLSQNAMKRGLSAILEFGEYLKKYHAQHIIVVGTHPFRKAENAGYFLEKSREAGIKINVLSEKEEALIAAQGALFSLDVKDAVIIDIGGGSTEISFFKECLPEKIFSFPIGAVGLKEKFEEISDISHISDKNKAEAIYDRIFDKSFGISEKFFAGYNLNNAICVGGAATTIAYIKSGLNQYDPKVIRGLKLKSDEISRLWNEFFFISRDEISKKFGINSRRSDIIHSGLFIIKKILKYLTLDHVTISDAGLLTGLMIKYIKKEHPDVKLPDPCSIYL
jgi:exopolyphosphatase/guanosine-5'-triphosphate,3'-diphosphate pyrophosphatase